jgi:hypothetical protein
MIGIGTGDITGSGIDTAVGSGINSAIDTVINSAVDGGVDSAIGSGTASCSCRGFDADRDERLCVAGEEERRLRFFSVILDP